MSTVMIMFQVTISRTDDLYVTEAALGDTIKQNYRTGVWRPTFVLVGKTRVNAWAGCSKPLTQPSDKRDTFGLYRHDRSTKRSVFIQILPGAAGAGGNPGS